jgi:colanic acid/amylovoran biosynthesis glycosyltransferase
MAADDTDKLKICHFVTYYLPVTQNWIYSQLAHNEECRATVLCQRLVNPKQFPFDAVYPICQSRGLPSVPNRLIHKIFERYPLEPHLSTVKRINPDILHGHFLLESWRNYRLVKRLDIPLVTTCYGQDVTSLLRKPFWAARSKKVFEHGAAFIVEGGYMGETLAAKGCPKEKIRVIKLGVDVERICGINNNMDEQRSPVSRLLRFARNDGHCEERSDEAIQDFDVNTDGDDKKIRILFTGLNREKKGAIYAAKAFVKALSANTDNHSNKNGESVDLELHLLGDGVYRKTVEKILIDAGVRQKAVFHGVTPYSRYLEILNGADIVLAPSVHAADGDTEGGAPVVVIEALCAGIPVVGSNHCDIPNIVSNGSTGLISAERDIDALARDIRILSADRRLRAAMGERGIRYARAEHDIGKQVRKITGVYKDVLKERAR